MGFKSACFISYPHNAGKSVDAFVTRLKEELQDRFAQFVTDPVLTDHDFPTGSNFNKAIAKAICQSACMLVVYMPVYQRKAFCIQEYTAMERHQVRRFDALARDLSDQIGMVLPLVYTGEESKIPNWISKQINYKNIARATVSDPVAVFDQQDFKEWLVKIANMVDTIYTLFQSSSTDPCSTCETDSLPGELDQDVAAKLKIPSAPPESFR